jgi:PAS domain S-box-containing protein
MIMIKKIRLSEYSRPAVKTAVYFFIFGFFWILLSDSVVHQIAINQEMENQMQTYKGWFFIFITTLLIYWMVKNQLKVIINLKNKLSESEEKYKKLAAITNDVVWYTDADSTILFINNACEQVFGKKATEMIGKKFTDFVPPEEAIDYQSVLNSQLAMGINPVEMESKITFQTGQTVFIKNNINVIFDENGTIIRFEGNSTNITKQKQYEKSLLNSKEKLEMAMSGGEIVMWDFSFDTKQLTINQHKHKILGYDFNDPAENYRLIADLIYDEDRNMISQIFGESNYEKDGYLEAELRMKHKDGNFRWITSRGKVSEWNNQKPSRIMGILMDTTTQKELELNLQNLVNIYSSFIKYSSEGIYLFEMREPISIDLPVEKQVKKLYSSGYIRTCNEAFARMYGHSSVDNMIGTDQKTLHGSDDIPENIQLIKNFIANGYRIVDEITYEADINGNRLYISNSVTGIVENGYLLRTWGIQRNITSQIIAQQKLEASENRYRLLFETNPVPLIIFKAGNLKILDANEAATILLDYPKTEIVNLTLDHILSAQSELTKLVISEIKEKEVSKNIESEFVSKTGIKIPCEIKFDSIMIQNDKAILGAINDLTAIKNTEKLVIQSLIEGADNERTRVSKEIHDGLGQSLTAANLNLNAVKTQIAQLEIKNIEKFETGLSFLKTAIEESRNIAHNLMPKAIEDFGIILSLKSLFNQIEKSTGLKIDFYENLNSHFRFDMNVELNLYRITQEALNNVIKHAGATEVFVQLMLHPDEIIYTFEDNGRGFDKTLVGNANKGIGLKSIANRAKAMSGHFDIDTSINGGTTLTIIIPFNL